MIDKMRVILILVSFFSSNAWAMEEKATVPAAKSSTSSAIILQTHVPHVVEASSVHVPTIVETTSGVFRVAWYAGAMGDGQPDVKIWSAEYQQENESWSTPEVIAHSREIAEEDIACWDPVFCKTSDSLLLFYKIGHKPAWTGFMKKSVDNGKTWSAPRQLPPGIIGPAKNKPLVLNDDTLICGSSCESWHSWGCYVDIGKKDGAWWSWEKSKPLFYAQQLCGVIQPTIFRSMNGEVRMLTRSKNIGFLCSSRSQDNGRTWSDLVPTALQSNDSGIDTVTLADGRVVLAYNNLPQGKRYKLHLAVSSDGGDTWKDVLVLDESTDETYQICYPSVIQASDGLIYIVYTYDRKEIRLVVVDPAKID